MWGAARRTIGSARSPRSWAKWSPGAWSSTPKGAALTCIATGANMIGHAVWFDALDSDYCGNGEVLNPDWGPILVPWNREPLEHKMCRCGETVMTYHQVLVSKELGGADLIALESPTNCKSGRI